MPEVLNMERIDRKLYTDRILSLLGKGEVVVLTGHRRAGKSCILECLAANLRHNDGHVLYVDMENPDYADITDFEQLNGWIKKHLSEKYYFEDLGIRNHLCRDKRQADLEKILENAVYIKLVNDGYTVYVGQMDGKEIDFVARRGDETAYYQVSLQISSPETYEREFGNLKRIKDNYPKYVVTMDPLSSLLNDNSIRVLKAESFL